MGQLADGIVLVLSAERTRRVTARNMKDRIEGAHARVLGTVLCDREFPIPEKIYRRL
jgi:Mrp family chromosome partitioning ATPase